MEGYLKELADKKITAVEEAVRSFNDLINKKELFEVLVNINEM
jgi:hypothetical protein